MIRNLMNHLFNSASFYKSFSSSNWKALNEKIRLIAENASEVLTAWPVTTTVMMSGFIALTFIASARKPAKPLPEFQGEIPEKIPDPSNVSDPIVPSFPLKGSETALEQGASKITGAALFAFSTLAFLLYSRRQMYGADRPSSERKKSDPVDPQDVPPPLSDHPTFTEKLATIDSTEGLTNVPVSEQFTCGNSSSTKDEMSGESLDLSGGRGKTGSGNLRFDRLKNLTSLNLSDNDLTDATVYLGSRLQEIDLSNNRISKVSYGYDGTTPVLFLGNRLTAVYLRNVSQQKNTSLNPFPLKKLILSGNPDFSKADSQLPENLEILD